MQYLSRYYIKNGKRSCFQVGVFYRWPRGIPLIFVNRAVLDFLLLFDFLDIFPLIHEFLHLLLNSLFLFIKRASTLHTEPS